MKLTQWKDLSHKAIPEVLERERRTAHAELDNVGLADLRRAQQQTQVEVAQTLGLPQASISNIEKRTDLLLSTLAKYVHALGGELQINAVFPSATFCLIPPAVIQKPRIGPSPVRPRSVARVSSSRQAQSGTSRGKNRKALA